MQDQIDYLLHCSGLKATFPLLGRLQWKLSNTLGQNGYSLIYQIKNAHSAGNTSDVYWVGHAYW